MNLITGSYLDGTYSNIKVIHKDSPWPQNPTYPINFNFIDSCSIFFLPLFFSQAGSPRYSSQPQFCISETFLFLYHLSRGHYISNFCQRQLYVLRWTFYSLDGIVREIITLEVWCLHLPVAGITSEHKVSRD